jgi:hypothetical protein
MPTAELQLAMHRTGAGPAALVPVPSGTVLLLGPSASLTAALKIAGECRKLAGRAVVLCWDDVAAVSYSVLSQVAGFWGWGGDRDIKALHRGAQRYGPVVRAVAKAVWLPVRWFRKPSKVDKAAGALSRVFGVDPANEQVKARLSAWERGGLDAVTALLGAAGLADVAQVVGLVHAGQAEPLVTALPRPAGRTAIVAMTAVVVGMAVLGQFVPSLLLSLVTLVCAITVLVLILTGTLVRRPVRTKPINAVLPVIPVTQGAVPTEQPPA